MSMEWEDLDPIVKTVPWAKAHITVNKDATPRLNLSLSEAMLNDIGHPKKANVQFGVRNGVCMVRLTFGPTGKFNVHDLSKGGARIHGIPVKAPAPDGCREAEPCEIETKTKTEAIIILPIEAWEKQLNQPLPPPPPKPAAPRPAPQAPQARAIDAVAYLRAKGVKISKMAGDWWMMDGNKVPRMEVLARVNEHRRHADLAPLGIDNIE